MINFLKKYKAFFIGAAILGVLLWYLSAIDFIRIAKDAPWETTILLLFWWLVISVPIHYINYLKTKKNTVIKVVVLLVVLFMIFGIDSYFTTPDHPLVILLLVVFWLGICYLIFPKFFIKYRNWILISYGLLLAYFFYLRMDAAYVSLYHNKAFNLLIAPIPFLFALWLYEQWKWFRNIRSEKAKAELELLKTQVNPHFFFNTLNNLYALTIKQSEQAPEVILKLSDMMRYTIYEGKKDFVPVEEEITYLKNYIALHEIRHHKKVTVNFEHHCSPEDKVPPLLFIIFLENAFKHGVEKLTENAYINIRLISDKASLYFTIENNFEIALEQQQKGIGLENLKRRLALLYPGKHKLKITVEAPIYNVNLILNTI